MLQKNFYLSKRGKVWYARLRDPSTRKIGVMHSTGHGNRTRAEAFAAAEYEKLEKIAGSCAKPLSEWAGQFYGEKCPHVSRLRIEGKHIADSTIAQNRGYIENYILKDDICRLKLGVVSRADVMAFRDRLIEAKGQSRTAQMIYGVLRVVLNEALERGLIPSSPTSGLKKIAYTKQPRAALPVADIQRILLVEHWRDLNAWRAIMTAAMTGMRAGEVRGLEWGDVDEKRRRIYIRHNIPCHASEVTVPKWGKERVTIYPAKLREVLEPLRQDDGYVFAVEGKAVGYDALSNALESACVKAKVRATMHQLRHSLNTHLRGAGLPDDLLRGSFGWSSSAVHDGYTHRELYNLDPLDTAISGLLK